MEVDDTGFQYHLANLDSVLASHYPLRLKSSRISQLQTGNAEPLVFGSLDI